MLKERLDTALANHFKSGRQRTLCTREGRQGTQVAIGDRQFVNFCSNDYLGLAADDRVIARVKNEVGHQGFGSGAAALLSGRSCLHVELERKLTAFTGTEAALLFSSGYLANLGALEALLVARDAAHHDRLNHASLIDGVIASKVRHRRFPHLDYEVLDDRLANSDSALSWVITESVFGMDGDEAPLGRLADICGRRGAELYIDDAHGFGVTGGGRGAFAQMPEQERQRSIFMVTFGKALGSVGAAILGSGTVIEYLVQNARTFVYDTALPPVCAAASLEALDVLETDPEPLQRLRDNISYFRGLCDQAGLELMPSDTPIQPLMLHTEHRAVSVAAAVTGDGFFVRAIRPPTVPVGTARIRITLSATHNRRELHGLVNSLQKGLAECPLA